jgi:hypothetical protein
VADLRRKQSVPPPPEPLAVQTVNLPGLKGQIPFSTSKMILTEAEKKVLKEQFGWKEGDPIPNLSQIIQAEAGKKLNPQEIEARTKEIEALQAKIKNTPPEDYPEGTQSLKQPEIISIENLAPEKRKEIEDSIREMKRLSEEESKKPTEQPFVPNDPSIAKANLIAQAQAAAQKRKIEEMERRASKVELHDDREEVINKQKAKVTRLSESKDEAPPPSPVTTTQLIAPVTETQAGADGERTHCQHCGWDLSKSDEAVITPEDKRVFTAAFIGGNRFVKTYKLLNGALLVTFRGLTTKETNLIIHQLFLDGKSGAVSSPMEVFRKAQEYQLAVSLQAIHSNDNAIDLPTIDKHELDQDEHSTGLPEILDYVYSEVVTQESLRKVLLGLYAKFDNTLSKLEVMSEQEGFWMATE